MNRPRSVATCARGSCQSYHHPFIITKAEDRIEMSMTISMTLSKESGLASGELVVASCTREFEDDSAWLRDSGTLQRIVSCALAACCQAVEELPMQPPVKPESSTRSAGAINGTANKCRRRNE
jgi:hypothetical protein